MAVKPRRTPKANLVSVDDLLRNGPARPVRRLPPETNEMLDEVRDLARAFTAPQHAQKAAHLGMRLSAKFTALDKALCDGGFLPDEWARGTSTDTGRVQN